MTFVDTNYFLRYFKPDIPEQFKEAQALFRRAASGKINLITSTVVLFEINWVLGSTYDFDREQIANVLTKVVMGDFVEIDEADIMRATLIIFRQKSNLSLEDCYNLTFAKVRGVTNFKTFDKKLSKAFKQK